MHTRPLGNTGLTVGEIGLGCGDLGKPGKDELDHVLGYAFDHGVNFYDTAEMYAGGESEATLGRFFEGRRDQIVLATKLSVVRTPDRRHDPAATLKHLPEAVDSSLRRLRTDWIDVYQLHNPPMSVLEDDALFEALDRLVEQGKLRCYGVSIDDGGDALRFLDRTGSRVVQMILNLFHQAAREPFLPEARRRGAGVVVKVPMAGGSLTGAFSPHYPPPDEERRQRWGEAGFQHRLELVEAVRPILESHGRTMAQGALAWLLTFDPVSVVIPGISSLEKVQQCIEAGGMRLTPEEMQQLDELRDGELRRANLPW